MEWQPIETAPKDGKDILIWNNFLKVQAVCFWDDFHDEWHMVCADGAAVQKWEAKAWMPLPPKPDMNFI